MGPITGLATIATALTVILVVAGLAVVVLTLAVVVPALRETRGARLARQVSIPRWYLHPATSH
ncbi:hypothetical protein [Oryzobacter telluris]|uniref:hypothetical protein n=1 Tax=Oryzobacter telluris TaxID=3149179 RepID=UPI00370DC87B